MSDPDIYDFGGQFSQVYTDVCSCGDLVEVSTQQDETPEYYTDVYVKCDCGKSVKFELPVN